MKKNIFTNNGISRLETTCVSIFGSNSEKDPFTTIQVHHDNADVQAALHELFDYFNITPKYSAGTYVCNGIPVEVFVDHAISYVKD